MEKKYPPLCCKSADIIIHEQGKISFGDGCIIHPKAKIIVEGACSIVFGEFNIVEEGVEIIAKPKYNALTDSIENVTIEIGNNNYFKIGTKIENCSIDNNNIFEFRSECVDSYIASNCLISMGVKIPQRTNIKSNSIVMGNNTIVSNSLFNEKEHVTLINEMYNVLSVIFNNFNEVHNIKV